jgi:hypothetical protein
MANESGHSENALRELPLQYSTGLPHAVGDDVDASLIAASLAMTP